MLSLRPFGSDFGDLFDVFNRDFTRSGTNEGQITSSTLRLDVKEAKDSFMALFDVPGIPKDHVKISVDGQNLTVSVDQKEDKKGDSKDGKVHWRERTTGFSSRTITLPENCDVSLAQAKQEHGVLTISIPKKQVEDKKKYISIK